MHTKKNKGRKENRITQMLLEIKRLHKLYKNILFTEYISKFLQVWEVEKLKPLLKLLSTSHNYNEHSKEKDKLTGNLSHDIAFKFCGKNNSAEPTEILLFSSHTIKVPPVFSYLLHFSMKLKKKRRRNEEH